MELWRGELPDFISGAEGTTLASAVASEFRRLYRRNPTESEYQSWELSLRAAAKVANDGARSDDVGVLVEYHLPLSERRIDVMFFGKREDKQPNSLLVELKRWPNVAIEDEHALNVLIGEQEHTHPSQQALDYAGYLSDVHSEYVAGGLQVQPCSYCHDMIDDSILRDPRFAPLLHKSPVFITDDGPLLSEFIGAQVSAGDGVHLMRQVRAGQFQPSKKVVDNLDAVLRADAQWHLLDEQRKAFNAILAEVERVHIRSKRSAVLVRGGPGTGKSVIAVQLLAEMLKRGLRSAHSTGGKAFTTVLRGQFGPAGALFTWNRSLRNAPPMGLDLLLVDEAHRIRETSDDRFTKAAERNRRAQVDELIDAAKVSVFFLDEHQNMRPDEIGDTRLIVQATEKRNIPLKTYDLSAQFRCGGSTDYLEWVNYLLGFRSQPSGAWLGRYEFRVVESADEIDLVVEGNKAGQSARLVAGFCWPWSEPLSDGTLVNDVVIGDWAWPWNRKEKTGKAYKPNQHPYYLWAMTPEGEGQVGCIYSAQGFEFDRVGVIWGPDLLWRDGQWVGAKKASKDPGLKRARTGEDVTRLVRQAYRVLLTRGTRATEILCLDAQTRAHIATCLALAGERAA